MISLASVRCGEMAHTTRALRRVAAGSSGQLGREEEGVRKIFVREGLVCMKLIHGDKKVECLCVSVWGKANKRDTVITVCYRPPNQNEEADRIFHKPLGKHHNS